MNSEGECGYYDVSSPGPGVWTPSRPDDCRVHHHRTPEPSEVAETTAGERCKCIPGICTEDDECCESSHCPASIARGDAGEVEALAKVILAERLTARELPNTYMDDAELVESMKPRARAILASPWFAAHVSAAEAKARADALREAADACGPELANEIGSGHTSTYSVRRWLRDRAASIARGDAR